MISFISKLYVYLNLLYSNIKFPTQWPVVVIANYGPHLRVLS